MLVSRRMTSNSSATSFGVSEEVGSSMTTTRASCASARAISTICCWLTGRRADLRAAGSTLKPMRSNSAAASAADLAPVDRADAVGRIAFEKDVLGDGELGDQRDLLEHHLDALPGALSRGELKLDLATPPMRMVPASFW